MARHLEQDDKPSTSIVDDHAADMAADSTTAHSFWGWFKKQRIKLIIISVASLGVLCTAFGVDMAMRRRRRHYKGQPRTNVAYLDSEGEGEPVRIPLKAVIRFKEKQWFIEELQASREGDPNSMLRLAKMYLHGQGCDRSVTMAQEWLRKARHLGVYATLDELWAGTPGELERELERAASQMRRRTGAHMGTAAAG